MVYVHIPFCLSKCHYCAFCSFPGANAETMAMYKDALLKEIGSCTHHLNETKSVFFGGGTPTVLPVGYLLEILEALAKFKISQHAEITTEANPGTVSYDYLRSLREGGFNRLSLGAQAMNDALLKKIGRRHSLRDLYESYNAAQRAGFSNINIDLMFGLPSQAMEDWAQTLEAATSLKPTHISCYSLSVEEDSAFGRDKSLSFPSEDCDREMYWYAVDYLTGKGYEHYEISNFAAKTPEGLAVCNHNLGYWQRQDYLGFGLSAHSFYGNARFHNTYDLQEYLSGNGVGIQDEVVTRQSAMEEFMFLGLRIMKGIRLDEFKERFGVDARAVYGQVIEKLKAKGLLEVSDGNLSLTRKGTDVSNKVMAEFLL